MPCFSIKNSVSYYKVACTSCMGNSCRGLNLSSYYENTVYNNRGRVNCAHADEPHIQWVWDLDMKQLWAPGYNTIKCDNLEERTSSAFIFFLPLPAPHFFYNTHQQSDHTGSLPKSTWWKWDGEAQRALSKGLGMFYFFSSWKLSVALWNKISFAGRKLYNQYVWQALKMWWSGTEQLPIYGIFVSPQ